jgi:hypothetical protein
MGYDKKYTQWRNMMMKVFQKQRDCPLLIQPDIIALLEEDVLGEVA